MKKAKQFSYTLSQNQRRQFDAAIRNDGIDTVLNKTLDNMLGNQRATTFWSADKNSYAFWGPKSAQLVKTPDSFYLPISYDAFCVSGTIDEFNLKSRAAQNAHTELICAAQKITEWAGKENLDTFFLKNSNFSGKHFWPYTCNIDFSLTPNMTTDDKIAKVFNHICTINSIAIEIGANPGLGVLARKKLDLDPFFYAFGSKFYVLHNTITGANQVLESNGQTDTDKYIQTIAAISPDIEIKTYHIGMPITKELRVFSRGGHVMGFVPYWSPVAFENIDAYNIRDNMTLDTAIKKMNTFTRSEINHIHDQTNIIIRDAHFSDTDWAIDWVITRDGIWYMTDMQLARDSYMDFQNMIFPCADARAQTIDFMGEQLQNIIRAQKNKGALTKLVEKLHGTRHSVDDILRQFGYPTAAEIRRIQTDTPHTKTR